MRARPDRRAGLQRHQQLRQRLDGADARAGSWSRAASPTSSWPSASRRCSAAPCRSRVSTARARRAAPHGIPARPSGDGRADRARAVRQCRPRAHGALRLDTRALRHGRREEPPALRARTRHAQFQDVYSLDEILASPAYHGPLTKLQCSPTSDGAAAAVLMSEAAVERTDLGGRAVEILAQAMASDRLVSFDPPSAIHAVGSEVSRAAAQQVYERVRCRSGGRPGDRAARLLLG